MSYKTATYISLIFIALINIIYLIESINLSNWANDSGYGPGFYPLILSILLFILIVLSFMKTYTNKNVDEIYFKLISGFKKVTPIIILIIVYLMLWSYFDYFYILSFFLIVGLIILKKPTIIKNSKELIISLIFASGYLLILYLTFNVLLSFNL